MRVLAVSDLHLSFHKPKPMDIFGPAWSDHVSRLEKQWREMVTEDDLVLLPGDISWAMTLEQAGADLAFINELPGKKMLTRGNHDYWWKSKKQMREAFPELRFLQNDAAVCENVVVGATRLWNHPAIAWGSLIDFSGSQAEQQGVKPLVEKVGRLNADDEKIWNREVERMKLALAHMDQLAVDVSNPRRVMMLHYPPLSPDLAPTQVTKILSDAGVDVCVFGHVHNLSPDRISSFDHVVDGVRYVCVSGDFVDFQPVQIF